MPRCRAPKQLKLGGAPARTRARHFLRSAAHPCLLGFRQ